MRNLSRQAEHDSGTATVQDRGTRRSVAGTLKAATQILKKLLSRAPVPVVPAAMILVLLVLPALFAGQIAPHDPLTGSLPNRLLPPAWEPGGTFDHLLGTDRQGRDIYSRVIYGARLSSVVAVISVGVAAIIGTVLGLIAGFYGGWVDAIVMRLVDITLAFPAVLFALALVTLFGPSFAGVLAVLVFVLWAYFARQVRGESLSIMKEDYISQARLTRQKSARIMVFHMLPNVASSIIVLMTIQFGFVIVLESTLSFLGIGLPRPTPAWGLMIADARDLTIVAWWLAFFPGLALTLSVLAVNMLGDGLRDRLDPAR